MFHIDIKTTCHVQMYMTCVIDDCKDIVDLPRSFRYNIGYILIKAVRIKACMNMQKKF